eukprot:gnl/MRDRNA2_/MRDRNA2_97232_c0_seq1.p1 gnl/MRDRNA2_/MRDRNA2_97232_c0~~gnl/MRDRNA2_/MRDRNA2_97232_c0_seq1.p1  ORF type:complete len:681 (+),score=94.30 gnl/MRDRNA2_/MRDRNA2_97232_c0_seq1:165-2207(+)
MNSVWLFSNVLVPWSLNLILSLIAFLAQANVKGQSVNDAGILYQTIMDKVVDRVAQRFSGLVLQTPLHLVDLDSTMLGKHGGFAIPLCSAPFHPSPTFPRYRLPFKFQFARQLPRVACSIAGQLPLIAGSSPHGQRAQLQLGLAQSDSARGGRDAQLHLDPISLISGTVTLPGSKSLSNRALLLASISEGTTVVENLLDSDDVRCMINALKQLGVQLDESARLSANRVVVTGKGGVFDVSSSGNRTYRLDVMNAGTVMRPLVAVLAASYGNFIIDGTERMRERPIQDLVDGLLQLGGHVKCTQNPPHGGCPPVSINAKGISGGKCQVSGKISSQYLSALLMASPLATGDVSIEVKDELTSKPYVDMTIGLMRKFGIVVEVEELSSDLSKPRPRFKISGGQHYRSPGSYVVEGDASSASYFLGAAAITGGPVTVVGCGSESVQGDVKFANVLEKMGATVEWSPTSITLTRKTDGTQPLHGVDVDCAEIPDAAMTLATTALFVEDNKSTAIRNVYNWRVKESERMKAIVAELEKLGATVEEGRDYCIVHPLGKPNSNVSIDTYDDHRMAMVFSLVACSGVAITINNPRCVEKTFPKYFEELNLLGRSIRAPLSSPLHCAAFVPNTGRPQVDHFVRRVGRPTKEWVPIMLDIARSRNRSATPVFELARDAKKWKQTISRVIQP